MGQNTDGLLIYGIELPEETVLPWGRGEETDEEWWLKETGYKPTFMPWTPEGDYAPGLDKDDPRVKAYFNEQRAWIKAHPWPVDLNMHCSGEYPMYIISPPKCEISAYRGSPEEVSAPMADIMETCTPEVVLAAKGWIRKYIDPLNEVAIADQEFVWILASLWN